MLEIVAGCYGTFFDMFNCIFGHFYTFNYGFVSSVFLHWNPKITEKFYRSKDQNLCYIIYVSSNINILVIVK